MATAEDREILRLALPAFLALVSEPLFLLTDAAIVGHLGTDQLAGQGVAAVVLQTAIGLCVFLAYGTTAGVARRLGAGDPRGALTIGIDGLWLALLIGVATAALGVALSGPLVSAFTSGGHGAGSVGGYAGTYLRLAFLGVPGALVMLAATGVLRGLQDTRTPLAVAVAGNALNICLNLVLVYGLGGWSGLGISGSALGTVLAQLVSAGVLAAVVLRGARRLHAPLRPQLAGIRLAARAGVPLVIRTLTLRAALLVTTYAVVLGAGHQGAADLAAHQIAIALWTFLAFALDAIAIAAQAITGRSLGAGDLEGTRALTRRMIRWGGWSGVATAVLLAASSPFLGALFTSDHQVRILLVPVLLVAAAGQPIAGVVFVLDGVLIGAGDGRYLAYAGTVVLVVYAPVALLTAHLGGGLLGVWASLALVFMGARLVLLTHRARGGAWLVTGVS